MKRYMYALSLISTAILSYLFFTRGNWLATAFAFVAFLFYTWSLASDISRARSGKGKHIDSEHDPVSDDSKQGQAARDAALTELRALLAKYTRQMRIFRNASVTLAIMAAVVGSINESLAVAILIIAMLALFKFWQNFRAVKLIRSGAGELLEMPPEQ